MVRFGINLLPDGPAVVEEVKLAEACGFDFATFVDSELLWMDVYAILTLCANQTHKIQLGPGVTNPYTRHPAVTASAIATIDELSGGRAVLGIGRGDSAVRTLGFEPVKGQTLKEYVEVCRRLTAGETVTYKGKPLTLRWAKRRIPVDIAASGPRTLALSGEIGDAVTMLVGANPGLIRWGMGNVRSGAEAAGRKLEELKLGAYVGCFVSDDLKKARDEMRGVAAAIINLYARDRHVKVEDLPPEIVEEIPQIKDRYHYSEHLDSSATHALPLTDRLIDKVAIVGPAAVCRERFQQLADCGLQHICLFLLPIQRREDREHVMRTVAEAIFPHLK